MSDSLDGSNSAGHRRARRRRSSASGASTGRNVRARHDDHEPVKLNITDPIPIDCQLHSRLSGDRSPSDQRRIEVVNCLTNAMARETLCSKSDGPILGWKDGQFLCFRNPEFATDALRLSGLAFGHTDKIMLERPKAYHHQEPEVIPLDSKLFMRLSNKKSLSDQRKAEVIPFLENAMTKAKLCTAGEKAVIGWRDHFICFSKQEFATRALQLNGTKFGGDAIVLERPKDYHPDTESRNKDLFVGNIPGINLAGDLLRHLLSRMLVSLGFARDSSCIVDFQIKSRRGAQVAFVTFATEQLAEVALQFHEMPFMGNNLKVDRVAGSGSRLDPGMTISREFSWLDVLEEGKMFRHDPISFPQKDKYRCCVWVGKLPDNTNSDVLKSYLEGAARQLGRFSGYGRHQPIIRRLEQIDNCAFVYLRTPEEALEFKLLNGIPFRGERLPIRRPVKYSGPDEPNFIWDEHIKQLFFGAGGSRNAVEQAARESSPQSYTERESTAKSAQETTSKSPPVIYRGEPVSEPLRTMYVSMQSNRSESAVSSPARKRQVSSASEPSKQDMNLDTSQVTLAPNHSSVAVVDTSKDELIESLRSKLKLAEDRLQRRTKSLQDAFSEVSEETAAKNAAENKYQKERATRLAVEAELQSEREKRIALELELQAFKRNGTSTTFRIQESSDGAL